MQKQLKEIGEKYGFPVSKTGKVEKLMARNTDGEDIEWITIDEENESIHISGNTDQCNLWFYETRKDLSPEKLVEFVRDLNFVLGLDEKDGIKLRTLVDPEDWQEIANVQNAYEDNRYYPKDAE